MAEAYPLHWPEGWPRTKKRERSRFNCTFEQTRRGLVHELELFGARYIILSTNVELRRDGYPYASAKAPDDPGVAVYFDYKGRASCIPCDKWDRVQDNLRAIEKTIDAMRGLARWGANDIVDRAFMAFEALPAPGTSNGQLPHEILNIPEKADGDTIRAARAKLARLYHPDLGSGDHNKMAEVNAAADAMLNKL